MTKEPRKPAFEFALSGLWQRAMAGDESAYHEALLRITVRLRGYFSRRLQGRANEVEDLVQETLLALHIKRETYDPNFPVSAWVLAIGKHKLIDHWRRNGRYESLHGALEDDLEMESSIDHQAGEAQHDIEKLLQELPDAQREAIRLTKLKGLSVAEAAQLTGATMAAIKVQVHRGLNRLSAMVKQ